jgi:hypothetical protein
MFRREKESVLSCIVARPGRSGTLQYGIIASVFNTEPGWAKQVDLKQNFTRGLISKWPNYKSQSVHGKI